MAAIPETTRASDLYERYSPRIYGYCMQRLGSREEAEDAVQTTFLNAFRGLSRGVVPESESAWLFKIAENVCLSRHRATFRRRRVEAPGGIEAVVETVPAPQPPGEELIPLEEALAHMPRMQRHALLLREWQGLSYREIAAELEVSQSAVETLIFRARRSLASRLEAPRERLRRVGQAIDVGSVLAALKGALSTGAAVKTVMAGIAVTGMALGLAVDRPQPRRHDHPALAGVAAAKRPVAPPSQRADAPLAHAPQPVTPASSRQGKAPAAKHLAGRKAAQLEAVAATTKAKPAHQRPASSASTSTGSDQAETTPSASAADPKPSAAADGKAHEQQAAHDQPSGKPAAPPAAKPRPAPQPKSKAEVQEPAASEEPGQPENPGVQGESRAKGKDK